MIHSISRNELRLVAQLLDQSQNGQRNAQNGLRGAGSFVPRVRTLPILQQAAQVCRGCDLYDKATQAVFGEGVLSARIVLGEQPNDEEDKRGRPFLGPGGHLLDRALQDAGIKRADVYVTNAVKHFRFDERGERRIQKSPSSAQLRACEPWLEAELQLLKPTESRII